MKFLKYSLLVLAGAAAAFAIYVATLPDHLTVARSVVVDAPPSKVFGHVNDLRKWEAWSPWAKRDPNSKSSYAGASSGVGMIFEWDGNDEVGKGSMEIVESRPFEHIGLNLTFERPFPGSNAVSFDFAPVERGTRVTWKLDAPQPFMERAILTLMGLDMDEMIGGDYEAGLASLKRVAEAE